MGKKHYNILHYLLIIVLMIAPVRGLLAAPQAACHMHTAKSVMSSDMPHDMSSHEMSSHDMSHNDNTSADLAMVMSDSEQQQGVNKQCCCCDDDCSSQCDMGLSAALMLQASGYIPVFINAANSISVNPRVLVRALTPPSRPPAKLS